MHKGDVVPDFTLPDQTGAPRQLSDFLANGPVVLFFYPAAMTYGCTKESCHFRDMAGEFAAVGAQPVGISADTVDKQKQFDQKESLGFPLLSDPDRTVAALFGVKRSVSFLKVKRSTSDRPQKRRNDNRSDRAASSCGSDSPCQRCSSSALNSTSGG